MRSTWVMLAAIALAACNTQVDRTAHEAATTGTVSQAITSGEDDARDRATVALMMNGEVYCTGTLISQFVVLTAGHCVNGFEPDTVYFGSDPVHKGGTYLDVVDFQPHPDFDPDTLENDIGVVALIAPGPVVPVRFAGSEDDEGFDIGTSLKIVGFGITGGDEEDVGTKRIGDTVVTDVDDATFRIDTSPSQTCKGDSGGPAFARSDDGYDVLVGVTSFGDKSCAKGGTDTRVSAYSSFVNRYVEQQHVQSSSCSSAPPRARERGPGLAAIGVALLLAGRRRRSERE